MNMGAGAKRNVFLSQRRHLGKSQSCLQGGEQEGMIAAPQPKSLGSVPLTKHRFPVESENLPMSEVVFGSELPARVE
jgi:hypothetical protein